MKNIWIPMIFVAVMIAMIAVIKKGRIRTRHYDEMQLKIRADAYQLGYLVTLLSTLAVIFLADFGALEHVADTVFAVFAALILGLTVFAVYCIMHEAFFSVGDRSGTYIGLVVVIVVLDGFVSVSRFIDGSILENGIVTFQSGSSTVMTLMFLAVLTALLVKRAQQKREAEE
ncbi:MAG: hypothetical protein IKQ10_11600 [Oscillospiraceae bacterium]|nr:hypothetical protein [Oscillospiraceae bacterium]